MTKKEAIAWHRKMWLYIAREIARNKKVMSCIKELKAKFCILNNVHPDNYCFCCEYVENMHSINCRYCPLVWNGNKMAYCCRNDGEYVRINHMGDSMSLKELYLEKNWKKQAKLAYKIAMLPERED